MLELKDNFIRKICSLIFIYLGLSISCSSEINNQDQKVVQILPYFFAYDVFGNQLEWEKLLKNNLIIMFLDSKDISQLSFFKAAYNDVKNNKIKLLVFAKDIENLIQFALDGNNYFYLIKDDDSIYRTIFNVPDCCELYFLYEKEGRLKIYGSTLEEYNRRLKSFISEVLNENNFNLEIHFNKKRVFGEEILARKIINKFGKFGQMMLIGAFFDLCSSCRSGVLFNELTQISISNKRIKNLLT